MESALNKIPWPVMYTGSTRTVLGEFSELQYSLSPSYQASRLLVYLNFNAGSAKALMRKTVIVLIETWKHMLYKGRTCAALLTHLSKAFDCLPHDLLSAKLHAYWVDSKSLRILSSYHTNRNKDFVWGLFTVLGFTF